MRLGIKGKQVLGVTIIVGAVVVVLSMMHLAKLAQVKLDESRARAELLANAAFHRAWEVVGAGDPYDALHSDPGLRSILESSLYSNNVTFAAIVDANGIAVLHTDPSLEGTHLPRSDDIATLLARSAFYQLSAIYRGQGRNLEFSQPLLLNGDTPFGAIRIGVSTLLIRRDLALALRPAFATALIALAVAVFGAMFLAQLMLRPIHVIRSGLTRLGKGEFGFRLDLDQEDEFGELGTFFNAVSAQLSADRTQMAGQVANLESAVEHLEDAVAIVGADGRMLFANPAMRALIPGTVAGAVLTPLIGSSHPLQRLFEQALASCQSRGPVSANFALPGGESGERMILAHPVNEANGTLVGIMLIVRNLEYLSQVESTVRYSRKLAALGRLSAGVAHEVKNPLNSMMIHLELLRQQFAAPATFGGRAARAAAVAGAQVANAPMTAAPMTAAPVVAAPAAAPVVNPTDALQHVDVIAGEIRRLDEVVQGFLKFTRPEDLKLQPVRIGALFDEIMPVIRTESERSGVQIHIDCDGAPDVNGDPGMLRQAFLNLALNACQAMPEGGSLTMRCESARGRRVAIMFTDTGIGIKPEHLQRIFDLYFTTKPKGSGIGLSMVYRTVQMHDGEIEVQSIPGKGTTFRLLLPQAS